MPRSIARSYRRPRKVYSVRVEGWVVRVRSRVEEFNRKDMLEQPERVGQFHIPGPADKIEPLPDNCCYLTSAQLQRQSGRSSSIPSTAGHAAGAPQAPHL